MAYKLGPTHKKEKREMPAFSESRSAKASSINKFQGSGFFYQLDLYKLSVYFSHTFEVIALLYCCPFHSSFTTSWVERFHIFYLFLGIFSYIVSVIIVSITQYLNMVGS